MTLTRSCMWRSIKVKPTEPGLYVVAKFVGDEMVDFCTDWACLEGYFGPNSAAYCGGRDMTHWMPRKEYRALLASVPRE